MKFITNFRLAASTTGKNKKMPVTKDNSINEITLDLSFYSKGFILLEISVIKKFLYFYPIKMVG